MDKEKNIQAVVSETEILHESSVNFLKIFEAYRVEKKSSTRKLVQGLMSDRAFLDIKKGKYILAKSDWEFLMQRMGIVTEYFETIVSRKELEDWRIREDICLLILENQSEAKKRLEQYRSKCLKEKKEIPKIQNQFCMKITWLLSKSVLTAEELYDLSCKAVACTVAEEKWQEKLTTLYLGPAELETTLLTVWSLYLLGKTTKALELYWKIKCYPKDYEWEPRMQQMIIPQIAWLGMKLYQRLHMDDEALKVGENALELLRDQSSQRYVYPILQELISLEEMYGKEYKRIQQLKKFKVAFENVYEANKLPCMRMWQCSSIKNSYDVSLILKRMRYSMEKTQSEVCTDENGIPFLSIKQLSRIEKGENRPSGEVFRYLTQKMGRKIDWIMPMLETDSIQALSIRQDIMYWSGMRQYDKEKERIEKLKQIIGNDNLERPYIRQEILFTETSLKCETNIIIASEAMKLYYKALSCTFPIEYLSRKQLPFIRREEGMIISNIAYLYHKMGETSKAQELFEKLFAAFRPQQQLFRVNNSACAVMLGQYSSLLGDLKKYNNALIIDNINLQCEINHYSLSFISDLLYNEAWEYYEIDKNKYKREYRQKFLSAWKIAEFTKDWTSIAFYKEREKKYLS